MRPWSKSGPRVSLLPRILICSSERTVLTADVNWRGPERTTFPDQWCNWRRHQWEMAEHTRVRTSAPFRTYGNDRKTILGKYNLVKTRRGGNSHKIIEVGRQMLKGKPETLKPKWSRERSWAATWFILAETYKSPRKGILPLWRWVWRWGSQRHNQIKVCLHSTSTPRSSLWFNVHLYSIRRLEMYSLEKKTEGPCSRGQKTVIKIEMWYQGKEENMKVCIQNLEIPTTTTTDVFFPYWVLRVLLVLEIWPTLEEMSKNW